MRAAQPLPRRAGSRTARAIPTGRCGSSTARTRAGPTTRCTRRCSPPPRWGASRATCCTTRPRTSRPTWPSRTATPRCTPQALFKQGVRASAWRLLVSPLARFVKFYFVKLGFLDGGPGFAHVVIGCNNTFHKYLKLIELQKAARQMTDPGHRRRGLHRLELRARLARRRRRAGGEPRQAHLRGQPREPRVASPATRATRFVRGDIGDRALVDALLAEHRPRAVVHFAAESHVDRSIHGPGDFVQTNVVGTFALLEAARALLAARSPATRRHAFRFLHVSTDEVYGSLGRDDPGVHARRRAYAPNSPYSASKAGSDHLVRAYHHTYGLPAVTTNCSNNYGPYQFPEKLIPLMIANALEGKPLPVYGDGRRCATGSTWATTARRSARCSSAAARARSTTSAATPRSATSRSCTRSATSLDRERPRDGRPPRAHPVRRRPPGPRPALRDRRAQDPRRARLGAARDLRDRAREDRALVPRARRLGGAGEERRVPPVDREELFARGAAA